MARADISRDLRDPRKRYIHPIFQQEKYLDDAVLTEGFFDVALLVRNLSASLGEGGVPGGDDWTVKESAIDTTNNFTLTGGPGSIQGQRIVFASGLPAVLIGDIEYNSALASAIHAKSDAIEATKLFDAGLNLIPNELVGRSLVPNIADGTAFIIVANSKNSIEVVSSSDMLQVAKSGDRYRVELTTPPSGTERTDVVYLDVYPSEIGAEEDPSLLSNVGGALVETAKRLQIQQVVRVRENVGTDTGEFADPVDPSGTGAIIRVYTDERGQRHGVIKLSDLTRPALQADLAPSVSGNGTVISDDVPRGFARFSLDELKDFVQEPGLGTNFKNATINPTAGIRASSFAAGNPFATVYGDLSKLLDQSQDITSPAVDTVALDVRTDGSPAVSTPAVMIDNKRKGKGIVVLNDDEGEEGIYVQQLINLPAVLIDNQGTGTLADSIAISHASPGIGIDLDVTDGDGIDVDVAVAGDRGIRVVSVSGVENKPLLDLDDNTVVSTGVGIATCKMTKTGASGNTRGNILELTYDGSPDTSQNPTCLRINQGPARAISLIAPAAATVPLIDIDEDSSAVAVSVDKAGGTTGSVFQINDTAGGSASGTDATIEILIDGAFDTDDRHAIHILRQNGQGPDIKIEKDGSPPTGDTSSSPCVWLDPTDWADTPHLVLVPLSAPPTFVAPAGAIVAAITGGVDTKLYINENIGPGLANNWALVTSV